MVFHIMTLYILVLKAAKEGSGDGDDMSLKNTDNHSQDCAAPWPRMLWSLVQPPREDKISYSTTFFPCLYSQLFISVRLQFWEIMQVFWAKVSSM
jgi:hypothetical protein